MHNSLEYYAPRWAVGRICKQNCVCGRKFARSDIVQIGIRKMKRDGSTTEGLAIEVCCPGCGKRSMTTFAQEKDFRQLLCTLLEEIQKMDRMKMANRLRGRHFGQRSKITEKEVTDFKKKLKRMKTYADLLKELGVEPIDDH